MDTKTKQEKRYRRHRRVRAKISGTANIPRFCVFRSNQHIYAQLINDENGSTLESASDLKIKIPKTESKEKEQPLKGKILIAYNVGQLIAQKAIKSKIKKVVFDRGGYKYHGRVKALADGARQEGLEF